MHDYEAPLCVTYTLMNKEGILVPSKYGDLDEPGSGFGGGNIIDPGFVF